MLTQTFIDAANDSRKLGELKDCAVKAISIAAKVPYNVAHQELKKLGRKDRKGTNYGLTEQAMDNLGFDLKKIYPMGATVSTVVRSLGKGTFFVRTCGHILTVIDGVAHDWTAGRRHKVREVFEVTAKRVFTKPNTVKHTVWTRIEKIWRLNNCPQSNERVMNLRKHVLAEMVADGINPTTARIHLLRWWQEKEV